MFISKQSMNSDWCGREILEAYKHDKELRCFALIEDDHIEGTEHEVTDIIPPMLYSYICENNQIVTYEMKEDAEEDDIESWRKSIESLNKKSISLPQTVSTIREYVFRDRENLAEFDFGAVSRIEDGAFEFPQNLKTIGESAFENCANLEFENETISDEIRIIDDQAFAKCDHLSIVKLPPKLIKIGKSVFKDCDSLKEVVIGKDVSYIGGSPFRGCQKLQNIRVNERNKYFRTTESDEKTGNVLYNKNRSDLICYPAGINEKSYKIPDSVTTICEWSFAYSQLEHIEISDSVDIIRENAFFKCRNLKEIRLPDGVTVLDDMAFRKCEKLQNVFIPSSVSRIGYAVFSGCEKVRVICDNEDSLAYKTFSNQNSVECVCKPKEFA